MPDPRISRLAEIVIDYSLQIREGQQVLIWAQAIAAPLAQEMYRLAVQRGAHPWVQLHLGALDPIFYQHASDAQLKFMSPIDRIFVEEFDARAVILSDTNTRTLSGVDPARQALYRQAHRSLMETVMERSAAGKLRWNVTLYPTEAFAQEADMSLADYEDFVYRACLVDGPDPVAAWQAQQARQQTLIDWLTGKHEVHVIGPDTDLRLGIAARTWVNGMGDCNMPDGEIFTGPEESRVDGAVRFSFPAIEGGREVEDVRLWFEGGRVVKWSAAKNEEFLASTLGIDDGARCLGEFAFGTNFGIQRFTKNMLFDEKMGGTVHMALGDGYRETGSQNRSAIHWDMLCDLRQGGEVRVDGELFLKDGRYLLWE